jgi:hypothetical protein
MTQLMLFDTVAPAITTLSTPVVVASAPAATEPPRGDVHRMGDLARLVLARYDMLAQRRAERAHHYAK